jgi:hypothetical protein
MLNDRRYVTTSDEFAGVVVRIAADHVTKCLGDGQRGAQLVGGVGCQSLLFGAVRLELSEEGVGKLAEWPNGL